MPHNDAAIPINTMGKKLQKGGKKWKILDKKNSLAEESTQKRKRRKRRKKEKDHREKDEKLKQEI